MRNKPVLISLVAICAVAFILRVVYVYPVVFGGGWVNFVETDAYNRMMYAQKIATMPLWNGLYYTVEHSLLFSGITALLSRIFPLDATGAWLPPIFAVVTILFTYGAAMTLFGRTVGILAALFLAVMPTEYFHRTLLGFADHHALEVLLLIAFIYFVLKKRWILGGITLFLYGANWNSGIYLGAGLLVLYAVSAVVYSGATKQPLARADYVVPLMLLGVALLFYLPLGGYVRFLWMLPGSQAVAVATTSEIVNTALTPVSQRTISELMPLLMPFGQLDFSVVITNLHLFTVTFLAGLYFLWRYRHIKGVWLLIPWTVVMLAMTLEYRRFLYYLTVNIAIISAVAVYEMAKYFKGQAYTSVIVLTIPLIVFSLPLARNIGAVQPFVMTQDWHHALVWLKGQPERGNVTAWSDYGHWIQYVSGKTPNYTPGPGGDLVARLYLSTEDAEAKKLLDELNTGYLIVNEQPLTLTLHALRFYAGNTTVPLDKTLAGKLYYRRIVPPYLELVYQNTSIKIYVIIGL